MPAASSRSASRRRSRASCPLVGPDAPDDDQRHLGGGREPRPVVAVPRPGQPDPYEHHAVVGQRGRELRERVEVRPSAPLPLGPSGRSATPSHWSVVPSRPPTTTATRGSRRRFAILRDVALRVEHQLGAVGRGDREVGGLRRSVRAERRDDAVALRADVRDELCTIHRGIVGGAMPWTRSDPALPSSAGWILTCSGTPRPPAATTPPAPACSRPRCSGRPWTGSSRSRTAVARSSSPSAPAASPSRWPSAACPWSASSCRRTWSSSCAPRSTRTTIPVVLGDMATATAPGEFSLVYLVFNTIANLLTQEAQVACFRNAARHLAPGGCFVIELWVPELRKLPPGVRGHGLAERARLHRPRHLRRPAPAGGLAPLPVRRGPPGRRSAGRRTGTSGPPSWTSWRSWPGWSWRAGTPTGPASEFTADSRSHVSVYRRV